MLACDLTYFYFISNLLVHVYMKHVCMFDVVIRDCKLAFQVFHVICNRIEFPLLFFFILILLCMHVKMAMQGISIENNLFQSSFSFFSFC